MSWMTIDMRHADPRRTKIANYDLGIAIARAFVTHRHEQRKPLKRMRRQRRELIREIRDERYRYFPEVRRRAGR